MGNSSHSWIYICVETELHLLGLRYTYVWAAGCHTTVGMLSGFMTSTLSAFLKLCGVQLIGQGLDSMTEGISGRNRWIVSKAFLAVHVCEYFSLFFASHVLVPPIIKDRIFLELDHKVKLFICPPTLTIGYGKTAEL